MKKYISLILLLLTVFASSGFGQMDTEALYMRKVESYTKMKRTGVGLAAIGAACTVAGIIMVSNADWQQTTDYSGNTNYNTDDPAGIGGMFAIVTGVASFSTGLVLGIIGSNKSKAYNEKLNRLNVGVGYMPNQKVVTLVYRF